MKSKFTFLPSILLVLFVQINLFSQTWTNYSKTDGILDAIVSSITQDKNGKMWFGGWASANPITYGLTSFDGNSFTNYTTADGLPSNLVWNLLSDSKGNLWAATSKGLAKFEDSKWKEVPMYKDSIGLLTRSIFEAKNGTLWVSVSDSASTKYSVQSFDGSTWKEYPNYYANQDAIAEDKNGNLYFGGAGVYKFDGNNWSTYDLTNGLSGVPSYAVEIDNNDNLWVANYSTGKSIDKFDGNTWTYFPKGGGPVYERFRASIKDVDGKLWFGGNDGLCIFDGNSWSSFAKSDGVIKGNVRSIFQDRDKNIWIGTWEGIQKYSPISNTSYTELIPFEVYPNPVSEYLYIRNTDNHEIKSLSLSNILGQKISTVTESEQGLDVSGLNEGTYLIKIQYDNLLTKTIKFYKL